MIINDKMQQGYTYSCKEPIGQNFNPLFRPELTPKQMLELGVFEGHYLNDCQDEFPTDWFQNAKVSFLQPDIQKNCFNVDFSLAKVIPL